MTNTDPDLNEAKLKGLMLLQLEHVTYMTSDPHLSDDECDYLIGAMTLGADLLKAWYENDGQRAREILTEDYIYGHYACDGISGTIVRYVKRTAPSRPIKEEPVAQITKRYFLVEATEISGGETRVDVAEIAATDLKIEPRPLDWRVGTARSIPVATACALEDVLKHG